MAGEGPDVLVLDNMPVESYINKGLLLDLSTFAGVRFHILSPGILINIIHLRIINPLTLFQEFRDCIWDFIRTCLGEENQQSLYYGLPVNKAALKKVMEIEEEEMDEEYEYAYGSYTISDAEGLFIHLEIYRPNEELQDALIKYMESVDTVYMKDEILENAVFEEGVAYIQGTKSLEDAVSAIEKKISIYMAE